MVLDFIFPFPGYPSSFRVIFSIIKPHSRFSKPSDLLPLRNTSAVPSVVDSSFHHMCSRDQAVSEKWMAFQMCFWFVLNLFCVLTLRAAIFSNCVQLVWSSGVSVAVVVGVCFFTGRHVNMNWFFYVVLHQEDWCCLKSFKGFRLYFRSQKCSKISLQCDFSCLVPCLRT